MAPRFLSLHPQTYQKWQRFKRQAEVGGEYRLARRLPAVLLNETTKKPGVVWFLVGLDDATARFRLHTKCL
jgi:hypothetical protein